MFRDSNLATESWEAARECGPRGAVNRELGLSSRSSKHYYVGKSSRWSAGNSKLLREAFLNLTRTSMCMLLISLEIRNIGIFNMINLY